MIRLRASRSSRKKPKPIQNFRISKIPITRQLTDHRRRLSRASALQWHRERPPGRQSSSLLLMEIGMATRMVAARVGYLVTTTDEGFSAQVGSKARRFQCINSFKRQDLGRWIAVSRGQASRRRMVSWSLGCQQGCFRADGTLERSLDRKVLSASTESLRSSFGTRCGWERFGFPSTIKAIFSRLDHLFEKR